MNVAHGGRRARRPVAVAALLAVLTALAACAVQAAPAAPAPAVTMVEAPVLHPGSPIAAPAGPVLLTLSGKIGTTNGDGTLRFDLAGLDQLGRNQVTVFEPWVKKDLTFQGVWLADLLAAAQAHPVTGLHLVALDEYPIEVSAADIAAGGIFLATRQGDGTPIPIEVGGPTRLVFVGGVPSGNSANQWIWSLATVEVR